MPKRIGDDERRRNATEPAAALRVGAADGHLLRSGASPMHYGIDIAAAPCIRPSGAPNKPGSRY